MDVRTQANGFLLSADSGAGIFGPFVSSGAFGVPVTCRAIATTAGRLAMAQAAGR